MPPIPPPILGYDLGGKLIEAGILPPGTVRAVIDINVDDVVTILYAETHADATKLDGEIIRLLASAKLKAIDANTQPVYFTTDPP